MDIEIVWVPGHEDVEGNEIADQAAKELAKSEGNVPSIPTSPLRALRSARSVWIKHEVAKDGNESWQSQPPKPRRKTTTSNHQKVQYPTGPETLQLDLIVKTANHPTFAPSGWTLFVQPIVAPIRSR
jgi:hypothetical protein